MDRLDGRRVLLGVGGSIAAYRALDVVRALRARGASVRVAPTKAALEFVGALSFEALSGERLLGRSLEIDDGKIPHVEEGYAADLVVVAPASADLLAKIAHGFADEGILATLLSYQGPLVVAPAMETRMWEHPATRANVATLVERGAILVGPDEGPLASGREGRGRLAPFDAIVEAILAALAPKDLLAKRVVVTAGPTVEDIDPVRFLSNRSSGKMGVAIARAAAQRGAHVTLVHGPLSVEIPRVAGLVARPIRSAGELKDAVFAEVARGVDAAILSAAVADFRPAVVAQKKIKKGDDARMAIDLVRTEDTLASLGARAERPFVVGFAAETNDVIANAQKKLAKKKCDLIVANDVSAPGIGFGSDENRVTLVGRDSAEDLPRLAKDAVADRILDRVAAGLVARARAARTVLVERPRVVRSLDAGGYYCEHTYFSAARAAAARGARVGFLHIPDDDEAHRLAEEPRGFLERQRENRAVVARFVRGLLAEERLPSRLVLTGFGPFKAVVDNPSGAFVSSRENLHALFDEAAEGAVVHDDARAFPLAVGARASFEVAWPDGRALACTVAHLPVDERAVRPGSGTALAELVERDAVVLALGVASNERDTWRVEARATDVNLRDDAGVLTRAPGTPHREVIIDGDFVGALIVRGGARARATSKARATSRAASSRRRSPRRR